MKLKILSWNIWISGHFDELCGFLGKSGADIIGLQEVQADDPDRDIIGYLTKLGYRHAFASVRHAWDEKVYTDGPAIFTTYPIRGTSVYMLSEKDPRAAVRADIDVADGVLHVFSAHLVHTHQRPSKVQEEQVGNLLGVLPRERTIVMGDFNATPNSATIRSMRQDFLDTDPASTPTWSVYAEGCDPCKPQAVDTRLDYIFTSKDMKTSSCRVERSEASDHLPISVVVEL